MTELDQKTAKANELFFVVDENDNPLSPLPRKDVHGHGIWHRVSHVWLKHEDKVLCQQRALSKELNPGYWESFFGGHLRPNESYEAGAVREMNEELGMVLKPSDLHFWKVYKFFDPRGYNNEFQGVFVVDWSGPINSLHFKDSEVKQVAWRKITDVMHAIQEQAKEKWTNCGYELDLLKELTK
jgi:isopentenyldiphosphate isomerase